jgi:hypothetical protein
MRQFISLVVGNFRPLSAQQVVRMDVWLDDFELHLYRVDGQELQYSGTADNYPNAWMLPAQDSLVVSPWVDGDIERPFALPLPWVPWKQWKSTRQSWTRSSLLPIAECRMDLRYGLVTVPHRIHAECDNGTRDSC